MRLEGSGLVMPETRYALLGSHLRSRERRESRIVSGSSPMLVAARSAAIGADRATARPALRAHVHEGIPTIGHGGIRRAAARTRTRTPLPGLERGQRSDVPPPLAAAVTDPAAAEEGIHQGRNSADPASIAAWVPVQAEQSFGALLARVADVADPKAAVALLEARVFLEAYVFLEGGSTSARDDDERKDEGRQRSTQVHGRRYYHGGSAARLKRASAAPQGLHRPTRNHKQRTRRHRGHSLAAANAGPEPRRLGHLG